MQSKYNKQKISPDLAKRTDFLFGTNFGRAKPLKSELRRRGIWQGFMPHVPDDWGRQLAAGRNDRI